MKMEQTQCSQTSAIKHHTPVNNPKDCTRHSEHGESFKSSNINNCLAIRIFYFNLKINSRLIYMNCVKKPCSLHNTFKLHLPNLMPVQLVLVIRPQFTAGSLNLPHLNECTHRHVSAWTLELFPRSRRGCEWFCGNEECVVEVWFRF
jgi:hypothetical protein